MNRTRMNSLKNLANMRKMIPQKYFPVFARVPIQAPHVFAPKLTPQEIFPACIGFVPGGTVRPVFPVLVFQQSKRQNRTRTTSSTVLGTPPNRTRTKKFPLEDLRGGCFVSWALNSESTEDWDFHRLEPYTKPYSDTS